ncbi:Nuclear transcription factor Y subunit B-5 [Nymphaea thermarum]|nr:Nuclear transcription factor Y subunit B-5 [Nymphaea thermarum]
MAHSLGRGHDSEDYNLQAAGGNAEAVSDDGSIREQDRLLPIANVGRIMKQILPSNAKVSKEAKETMQECVSEFISFVTGEASEKCRKEKRKTINGDDLCWAMGTLGFDDYVEPVRRYLQRYRETEGEKSNSTAPGYGNQKGSSSKDGSPRKSIQFEGQPSNPHMAKRNSNFY